jgi:hypothetical protein
MPEVPHDHSSPSPSKEVLNEEIISQLRESLPPLREAVHFTYSPKTNDEVETFKIQEQTSVTAPLLPDPQKLEKFYLDSLPHLEIPKAQATTSETINLDEMLALVRPKKAEHAARILTVALTYWRAIDGRAFGAPPYQTTPFKELVTEAHTARELLEQTKRMIKVIKAHFLTPPEKILQTFIHSTIHYRGEPAWRTAQEASLMAAYELVFDSGANPLIPRPELQRSEEPSLKDPSSQLQEQKPRKTINYGRPAAATGDTHNPGSDEPTQTETRRKELEAASAEGAQYLHKRALNDYEQFKNEIRKPQRIHERYGPLASRGTLPNTPHELQNLPTWIQHAIDVSASDLTRDSRPSPPIQDVALEVATWATRFIHYSESNSLDEYRRGWDLAWIEKQLIRPITYHKHCQHIVRVVEDISQQIRELGGYESLRSEDKAVVNYIAPLDVTASTEIKNSWNGEPISQEYAGAAAADRMQAEQIRLLAISYLKNRPGKLRFIDDGEAAWKLALEMARESITAPKRPLGQ